MRSFAFSSIQDQRAELERVRGRGGEEFVCLSSARLSICLSIYLCAYATQFSEWDECCTPKANRQTDRRKGARPFFNTCTLSSSSPPPSSHIWLGFFLVCFCHSLGCLVFFLVWVYFWYPLTKSVTPAPPHYSVSLHCLSQHTPFSLGVRSKDQFPK